MELPADDPRHGKYTTYSNDLCRCQRCRAAAALYAKKSRERRKEEKVPAHLHGTVNAYTNYGCRCKRCRAASHRAYKAKLA